jgi:hypothetical protein
MGCHKRLFQLMKHESRPCLPARGQVTVNGDIRCVVRAVRVTRGIYPA